MDYFKQEISSSYNQPYFRNKVTNETQWGFKTYYKTKRPLPKGWIRLNLNGKPLYKYTKPNKKVLPSSYSYSSYAYAPRELEEILKMSYEDLLDEEEEEQQEEAYRRYNLFQKVARLLKLRSDSICDESLEFLARKSNVPVEQIIAYIEETERKELGEKAILTPFSRIKRTDRSFSSKKSIRELCGLNTREVEASTALSQIEEQFTCSISLSRYTDPVVCSSGHTFERNAIIMQIQTNGKCPITRQPITGQIVPNYALRKVIDDFIEKYKNQKGDHWAPILEFCVTYMGYSGERLQVPIDVKQNSAPRSRLGESLISSSPSLREHVIVPRSPAGHEHGRYWPALGGPPEELQTGRNPDEIREFLTNYGGYDTDVIDDIPELVAASENSSYDHARDQANRRIDMRERLETGRNSDEIREFLTDYGGYDTDEIDDIPELVAASENSSYDHAIDEANRRIDMRGRH